jgi:hypothetical protein
VTYDDYGDPNRLYSWETHPLTAYSKSSAVLLENFDIANVTLTDPSGGTIRVPFDFTWVKRPTTPSDSYEVALQPYKSTKQIYLGLLGYTDHLSTNNIPPEYWDNFPYDWFLRVHNPNGGFGRSSQTFSIYISGGENPHGIFGWVTDSGDRAAGIILELRLWDGSAHSTVAATTTTASGFYDFAGVASLENGQSYDVLYRNEDEESHLAYWVTHELTSYTAGSYSSLENFDIANVSLRTPLDLSTTNLPVSFEWLNDPDTRNSYEFILYSDDGDPNFTSGSLGNVGQYTLNVLPSGFNWDTSYAWGVIVHNLDDGSGSSFQTFRVTFSQQ